MLRASLMLYNKGGTVSLKYECEGGGYLQVLDNGMIREFRGDIG